MPGSVINVCVIDVDDCHPDKTVTVVSVLRVTAVWGRGQLELAG